jgi:hypothetical protein
MSLADLVIETATVGVGSTSFTVRGLCFNDITQLLRPYGEQINGFIDGLDGDVMEGAFNLDPLALLAELPEVMALAIALAADEPEQAGKVAKMNLAAQAEALLNIGRMTVEEAGGLGKLIELVMSVVRMTQGLVGEASTGIANSVES